MALSKRARTCLSSENSMLKYGLEDDNTRIWVRDINKERENYGEHHTLFKKSRYISVSFIFVDNCYFVCGFYVRDAIDKYRINLILRRVKR